MYVNEIADFIDTEMKHFNKFLQEDSLYKLLVGKKNSNYVEYRSKINSLIKKFIDKLNTAPINKLIKNKNKLH